MLSHFRLVDRHHSQKRSWILINNANKRPIWHLDEAASVRVWMMIKVMWMIRCDAKEIKRKKSIKVIFVEFYLFSTFGMFIVIVCKIGVETGMQSDHWIGCNNNNNNNCENESLIGGECLVSVAILINCTPKYNNRRTIVSGRLRKRQHMKRTFGSGSGCVWLLNVCLIHFEYIHSSFFGCSFIQVIGWFFFLHCYLLQIINESKRLKWTNEPTTSEFVCFFDIHDRIGVTTTTSMCACAWLPAARK